MTKNELIEALQALPGNPKVVVSVFGGWCRDLPLVSKQEIIPFVNNETGITTYVEGNRRFALYPCQVRLSEIEAIVL